MKSLFSITCALLLAGLPALTSAVTVPNTDIPLFYLVSSSTSSSSNLLALKMNPSGTGLVSLTGTGSPAQFYFSQGQPTVLNPTNNTTPYRPLIDSAPGTSGCQTFGALALVQESSSNKCARFSTFAIQSDGWNSQLGAQLTFNSVGGFYSCSNDQQVWYKTSSTDGPSGCQAIGLWTVPVA